MRGKRDEVGTIVSYGRHTTHQHLIVILIYFDHFNDINHDND